MKGSDKVKLLIAIVILVVAGVLIAWQMGFIGGGGSAPKRSTTAPAGGADTKGGGSRSAPGEGK